MDIQPSLLASSLSAKTPQTILSQWLVGQILNATVTARKPNNSVILQINNQQIEAKTTSNNPINVGTQFKLLVEQQGDPTVLRIVQHNSPKFIAETRQQLLRENLPKQAGMDKLTQLIQQVSNDTKSGIKALPAPIEKQIQKIIERLPTKSHIKTEAGLKSVIKDSGLFMETKLLSESTNKPESKNQTKLPPQITQQTLVKDLKVNLLQLSDIITKYKQTTNAPEPLIFKGAMQSASEKMLSINNTKITHKNPVRYLDIANKIDIENISKQLESSIARIEVNQTKAIVTNDNPLPTWSIETPVKDKHDIDLLRLNIKPDKDPTRENGENQLWTVNLKINFQNIGSISARLSLYDKEINATLWSESKILNSLINDNLSRLGDKMKKCGLSPGKIECLERSPIEQNEQQAVNNLISITI